MSTGPPSVLLIRHAQSVWNAEARWQGQADPPLSDDGEAQAEAACRMMSGQGLSGSPVSGPWPGFDLMISSDLKRARSTAERLAACFDTSPPHLLEPAWREYDVGEWSGLTRSEIEARWPDQLAAFDSGRLDSPPGGESRAAFDERVRRAAALLSEMVLARQARTCLVVTHGGVIRSLARSAGVPEVHIGHLSGYQARVVPGGVTGLEPVSLVPALPAEAPDGGEQDAL